MVTFGISSWSVHRSLTSGKFRLLDLPKLVIEHGLTDLQICHFHLPSREDAYLDELRAAIDSAGVSLDALLIDFGDISHPDTGAGDAMEIETWLNVAARLGATHARVSAGGQMPTEASLGRSARHLLRLSDVGASQSVRVVTENWHAMMPGSREVLRLIELTAGRVPLCLDFGNWSGANKYEELAAITPHAVTVHAKCAFTADGIADVADFGRCLGLLRDVNYAGTVALIYDASSDDEWRGIDRELSLAHDVLA